MINNLLIIELKILIKNNIFNYLYPLIFKKNIIKKNVPKSKPSSNE